jgi:hypothetical protein
MRDERRSFVLIIIKEFDMKICIQNIKMLISHFGTGDDELFTNNLYLGKG